MSSYWESRYRKGGTSGVGSRLDFAVKKASFVNRALTDHQVSSVLDLGCGDGYVTSLLHVGDEYLGVDPAPSGLAQARDRNPNLRFATKPDMVYDAHLSLDVIRHLPADVDYYNYMGLLFAATKLVLVWSSDVDAWTAPHDRQRCWTPDIPDAWEIESVKPVAGINSSFYVLVRK